MVDAKYFRLNSRKFETLANSWLLKLISVVMLIVLFYVGLNTHYSNVLMENKSIIFSNLSTTNNSIANIPLLHGERDGNPKNIDELISKSNLAISNIDNLNYRNPSYISMLTNTSESNKISSLNTQAKDLTQILLNDLGIVQNDLSLSRAYLIYDPYEDFKYFGNNTTMDKKRLDEAESAFGHLASENISDKIKEEVKASIQAIKNIRNNRGSLNSNLSIISDSQKSIILHINKNISGLQLRFNSLYNDIIYQ